MNKLQVQARVLQNGKPLDLNKFTWDEATKTFVSREDYLFINFNDIDCCTLIIGSYCIFYTGSSCSLYTGQSCTLTTRSECVVVRRDTHEVIELVSGETITLNGNGVKGYKVITKPKTYTVELTEEQMQKLNLQVGD